jgi:hypothetical protein
MITLPCPPGPCHSFVTDTVRQGPFTSGTSRHCRMALYLVFYAENATVAEAHLNGFSRSHRGGQGFKSPQLHANPQVSALTCGYARLGGTVLSDSGSGGVRFWEPILRQQNGADIRERFITRATELLPSSRGDDPALPATLRAAPAEPRHPRPKDATRGSNIWTTPSIQGSGPRSVPNGERRVSQSWTKNTESDIEPDAIRPDRRA